VTWVTAEYTPRGHGFAKGLVLLQEGGVDCAGGVKELQGLLYYLGSSFFSP